jgi:hypothetical protein
LKAVRTQEKVELTKDEEATTEEKEKFEKDIFIKQTFLPAAKEGEEKPLEQVLAMTNMQSLSSLSNGPIGVQLDLNRILDDEDEYEGTSYVKTKIDTEAPEIRKVENNPRELIEEIKSLAFTKEGPAKKESVEAPESSFPTYESKEMTSQPIESKIESIKEIPQAKQKR